MLNGYDKDVHVHLSKCWRAAGRNIPSQVRHCAITPKIIIKFWQK